MIHNRWHNASHSSIEWVVSTTHRPLIVALTNSHINRRAIGSIPVDGSSRNTMGGLPIIAMATDSLRLFPPEYVPSLRSAYFVNDSTSNSISTSFFSSAPLFQRYDVNNDCRVLSVDIVGAIVVIDEGV